MLGLQLPLRGGEGFVEGIDDQFLQFRTAEALGGPGHRGDVVVGGGALAPAQVDHQDLGAVARGRQVHEKDLVQAPLAQHLRGELGREVLDEGLGNGGLLWAAGLERGRLGLLDQDLLGLLVVFRTLLALLHLA